MARIVCIHGIAQELKGPETLLREWGSALRDGMQIAGVARPARPSDADIEVAFFGDLFRNASKGLFEPRYQLQDIDPGFEEDLLRSWATDAIDPTKAEVTKAGWAPHSLQWLFMALLELPYFHQVADFLLIGALKQLRSYFSDSEVRMQARSRLASLILPDTELVIAHSLGSVVAYEVLCLSELPAKPALITLGSPLGLRNLVFDRLDPLPVGDQGWWPRNAATWTNIADGHDIVASEKYLCTRFGARVKDILINNGSLAHDIAPYFTSAHTGKAVFEALRDH
jgi:hypothetical protein